MKHRPRFPLLLALALALPLAGCSASSPPPTEDPADSPAGSLADTSPLLPLRGAQAEQSAKLAALEAEMQRVPIAMYMTNWCPVCRQARQWLTAGGYNFVEHDVEVNLRAARILREHNPRRSVPMFDIDGQMVIGFNPTLVRTVLRRAAERRNTERLRIGSPEACGGQVADCMHRR